MSKTLTPESPLSIHVAISRPYVYGFLSAALALGAAFAVIASDILDEAKWAALAVMRNIVLVMPFYDPAGNICLVNNPNYESPPLVYQADCWACEELSVVSKVTANETAEELHRFLDVERMPVVVSNDSAWVAEVKPEDLVHETAANNIDVCSFSTNLNGVTSVKRLSRAVKENAAAKWFAYWKMCNQEGVKFTRKFYKRPKALPRNIQMQLRTWVYVSTGYGAEVERMMSLRQGIVLQSKGTSDLRLLPDRVCDKLCRDVTAKLGEGEYFIQPTDLYDVNFFPNDHETVMFLLVGDTLL